MQNITEYSCPCCGRELAYDPQVSKMKCIYCGNLYDVSLLEQLGKLEAEETTAYDWGSIGAEAETEDKPVYICQSCGAELETDENTIVYRCPYCDSEVLIKDNIKGGLRPQYVIPFKILPNQLVAHLNKYYKGMKLLPRDFFEKNVPENIQGVYIPYWLYSGKLEGMVAMDGSRSTSFEQGDEKVTLIDHFLITREGSLEFENVPADASKRMDDTFMKSIEPYDYKELVPFSSGYLPGFMAERFDDDAASCGAKAEERMKNTVTNAFARAAPEFHCKLRNTNLKLSERRIDYALLPVYRFQCDYGGKKYKYVINGQTGKVFGHVPIDKTKKKLAFWIPFCIVAIIVGIALFYIV